MRALHRQSREKVAGSPVLVSAGIGLKPQHYKALLESKPELGFLEVHMENFMGRGGPPHRWLEKIAQHYMLSFHGVGLSLGGADRPDAEHLRMWCQLVDRYEPAIVSEHIAWCAYGAVAHHDLLPIPYTDESLDILARNIDIMQQTLGRQVLVENPSRYLSFCIDEMPEEQFISALVERVGCGLLLDVNNVFVSAHNLNLSIDSWKACFPFSAVQEIHLAGHSLVRGLRIDDHGSRVSPEVWALFRDVIKTTGPVRTLIEWDTDIPKFDVLIEESDRVLSEASEGLRVDVAIA